MSELLNQTLSDIEQCHRAFGDLVEDYFLSETQWHTLRSELVMREGKAPGDDDYPLMNFYLHGVRVCIRASIGEDEDD